MYQDFWVNFLKKLINNSLVSGNVQLLSFLPGPHAYLYLLFLDATLVAGRRKKKFKIHK